MINEGTNCIGGVVVNVLTSNVVDRGFSPDQVKPKTIMVQWNLSNPTHQGTREMCRIVQDVGILRFYFN